MHFVGLDLAWGGRLPTGIAVLDHRGRLVHLASAVSDEDVVSQLAPWRSGSLVVGIDAPLVVTNPTGRRPAEAALGRDFAAFDAGAHPVNTGRPGFAGQPRGARLAEELGLEIGGADVSGKSRRAVEVYPHPALVALFRLGRVLKYKQKQGRSFELVHSELIRLTTLLEGLDRATPPLRLRDVESWMACVDRVRTASRKSELRPAEDEVDAVVCAYVAQLVARAPDRLTTYGDPETGQIVTPTLPDGHHPSPRASASENVAVIADSPISTVRTAVETYAAQYDDLASTTEALVAIVTSQLDDAGINYLSVTGRAKGVTSFAGKAMRVGADGAPLFADPLADITDQIGLRVITYLREDVDAVADLLTDQYVVLDDRDMGRETAQEGRFGYASRHLLVATPAAEDCAARSAAEPVLKGRAAQVQIRTVLQHAWAEFEHDIRYKGTIPAEHASDLDRRFTLAAGLLELADQEFSSIRARLQGSAAGPQADRERDPGDGGDDPRIAASDLATFLSSWFPGAGWSRTDHYEWISGLLLELGIASLDELGGRLASIDVDDVNASMGYRYPAGAVRRLDDALLALYGDRYVTLTGNAHRVDLLHARLAKLEPH